MPLPAAPRNFYPRSPCGERHHGYRFQKQVLAFLSTLSLRRATPEGNVGFFVVADFYPRSPCGERLSKKAAIGKPTLISIHALLAESDHDTYVIMEATKLISIHALLAESDPAGAFAPPVIL